MWLWLFWIWLDEEFYDKCSDPVNLFGFVYLILGALGIGMLLLSVCGICVGKMRKGQDDGYGIDNGLYDTGDVDFDPYQ